MIYLPDTNLWIYHLKQPDSFVTNRLLLCSHWPARVYGILRAGLARNGIPIGPLDLQIASIAVFHDCTLVSHNTREFSSIDGLRIEDWETIVR